MPSSSNSTFFLAAWMCNAQAHNGPLWASERLDVKKSERVHARAREAQGTRAAQLIPLSLGIPPRSTTAAIYSRSAAYVENNFALCPSAQVSAWSLAFLPLIHSKFIVLLICTSPPLRMTLDQTASHAAWHSCPELVAHVCLHACQIWCVTPHQGHVVLFIHLQIMRC